MISGTPTSNGTNNFTVQVTDALSATATRVLTLYISPPLQVTTVSLPNGTNGAAYSQALAATGGQPPYGWSLISGSLPAGLTLAPNSVISGTPTSNGTNNCLLYTSRMLALVLDKQNAPVEQFGEEIRVKRARRNAQPTHSQDVAHPALVLRVFGVMGGIASPTARSYQYLSLIHI